MGFEYESGYCYDCGVDRKLERKTANHILHLLITLVLGFLTLPFFFIGGIFWIVVWIFSSIQVGNWRCSTCGSSSVSHFTSNSVLRQVAETEKASKLFLFLGWVFGSLLFIIGLALLFSVAEFGYPNLILSVTFFIASFLLLPPIRRFAYEKTKIKLNLRAKQGAFSLVFLSGIAIFTIALVTSKDFHKNTETSTQISISKPTKEITVNEKIEKLEAELRQIDTYQIADKIRIYNELLDLNPNSQNAELYLKQLDYYKSLNDFNKECKEKAEMYAKFKMKHPSSFSKITPISNKFKYDYLIVSQVNFTASNSFGAKTSHQLLVECIKETSGEVRIKEIELVESPL